MNRLFKNYNVTGSACAALCWLLVAVLGAGLFTAANAASGFIVDDAARQRLATFAALSCMDEATLEAPATTRLIERGPIKRRGRTMGERVIYEFADGARITAEYFGTPGAIAGTGLSLTNVRQQPRVFARVNEKCEFISGRALRYDEDTNAATGLVGLDKNLDATGVEEPVNPAIIRTGAENAAVEEPKNDDPGNRIRVALVDSGVDYRQPWVVNRIAQEPGGQPLGYDFWDNDARPFDANPVRSVFFPARHGTRVASVLLNESPVVELVPYRYPRSDMSRMQALIDDAQRNGVRIMNLSLGSRDKTQWTIFEDVARKSEILFVVSAGNDGSNLDDMPLFPASMDIDNMLVVTSANDDGTLARGSGFGRNTVDLSVSGERLLTRGFGATIRESSGSSFAAARVSALAACLLAAEPELSAMALRTRLLGFGSDRGRDVTSFGFVEIALDDQRGACAPVSATPTVSKSRPLTVEAGERIEAVVSGESLLFSPTILVVSGDDWPREKVDAALAHASRLFTQCNVSFHELSIVDVAASLEMRQISRESMERLVDATRGDPMANVEPRIFLMQDTLREIEFGAEAIGRSNARRRPKLKDTVWVTGWSPHPGTTLAHELVHMLSDSGLHKTDPLNLMFTQTSDSSDRLTEAQCGQIRNIGLGNGLLRRSN